MKPTALEIMKAVAEAYGITIEELRSHSRIARIATARAVVCYLLYRNYNYSTKDVGNMVLRDHTTVIHARNKITDLIKESNRVKIAVSDIKSMSLRQ